MMRQQKWSSEALKEIQTVINIKKADEQKKYKTHCKKTAGLIQRSGLIQTLCFLRARLGKEMGDYFCDDLAKVYGYNDGPQLVSVAQKAELPEYLAMTRDCIEIAIWFRRFSQIEMAHIEDENNGDS